MTSIATPNVAWQRVSTVAFMGYRTQEFMEASSNLKMPIWTCDRCGAFVGPRPGDKSKHDQWHDDIDIQLRRALNRS